MNNSTPRTFLIAGGNTGIAAETVKLLAGDGHHVICAARQPKAIATSEQISVQAFNATQHDSPLLDLPEALDGLAYFPGTITLKPFHRLEDSDFLRDLEVNLFGAIRLIRQALPALKKSTTASPGIVLFSTVAVQTGMQFHASIAAAKGAVEGLVRSLAADLAPGIRVNAIAPSLTDTPLAGRLLDSEEKSKAARERHPLKQIGDATDLAAATQFLLSDHASFMTGQIVKMDGGLSSVKLF